MQGRSRAAEEVAVIGIQVVAIGIATVVTGTVVVIMVTLEGAHGAVSPVGKVPLVEAVGIKAEVTVVTVGLKLILDKTIAIMVEIGGWLSSKKDSKQQGPNRQTGSLMTAHSKVTEGKGMAAQVQAQLRAKRATKTLI